MYEEHSIFETPASSRVIWRYMSFARFVWLISEETLYFSRVDQHEDSWEGMLPKNWSSRLREYARFTNYISCWHMNSGESDAMWKVYGSASGETIAIKTTIARLVKSLERSPGIPVFIGKVKYDERDKPEGNLYLPVIHKRKPFKHERELRLCVCSESNDNPPNIEKLKREADLLGIQYASDGEILRLVGEKGLLVKVDLNQLIREVVIHPSGAPSFATAVRYVTKSKVPYAKIKQSKMKGHVQNGLEQKDCKGTRR